MNKFIDIFCIFVLISVRNVSLTLAEESEEECKKLQEKSPHLKLKKYLFCEYEHWGLPTLNEKNGTTISIGLAPKMANFNEAEGTLEIFGWMFVSWDDPHLKWDPTSFGDVAWLRINSYEMWEPEIAVLSGGNEDSNEYGLPWTICYLSRRGMVVCTPQVRHTMRCQTDFSQWPFDRQNCTLVFSTWMRSSEQIKFSEKSGETIVMDFFQSNGEWKLTASAVLYDQRPSLMSKREGVTSPRLSINFIVDRVHNQLSGRYISPAAIMMVMTMTTLWLDPRSIERLSVACVNPIIHLFCIQNLHWVLPHNGSTVPGILLFYANSLVLATIALLLTFVLGNVKEIKIHPPKWVSSVTATILRSRVGQILLLSMLDPKVAAEVDPDADDSGDLVNSDTKTTAWHYVAIMCGWISFITILFAYAIMYAVLIPNAAMRPPINSIGYFGMIPK